MNVKKEPLAYRMRPRNLDEFVGQDEILAEGKMLNRMIRADRVSSIILYGPPGTGKTSLARIIADTTKANFEKLNAVTAGIADIKKVVADTSSQFLNKEGRTVLFVDEIHRFNKAQQDALLPYVEDGTIILIGATTENPFFEVNKALISRSTVFRLVSLSPEHIKKLVRMTLQDTERGLGNFDIEISEEALEFLSEICGGDARIALNAVELATMTSNLNADGKIIIDRTVIEECAQKRAVTYDKTGDNHYDNISALIKSMRGSDPDASLFYLARAIYAGEDPEFLARRIIICASEDVGMANPTALQVAIAAAEGVKMIGMPEGRILLAQAAVMVATSPKSNASFEGINKSLRDIENKRTGEIPLHLRNPVTQGLNDLGYGKGYKYAHAFAGNYVKQNYFPPEMEGTIYYSPTANGYELKIKEWLERVRGYSSES